MLKTIKKNHIKGHYLISWILSNLHHATLKLYALVVVTKKKNTLLIKKAFKCIKTQHFYNHASYSRVFTKQQKIQVWIVPNRLHSKEYSQTADTPLGGGVALSCCVNTGAQWYSCSGSRRQRLGVPVLRFAAVSLLLHITQSNSIFLWFGVFCLWGVTHLNHRPCWDVLHSDIPSSITFSGTLTRLPPILYGYVCLGGRTLWFCLCGHLKT